MKTAGSRTAYFFDPFSDSAGYRGLMRQPEPQMRAWVGAADSAGVRITAVQPGSAAEAAGVRVGDVLLALGDVAISDPNFGPAYRARFRDAEGQDLPIKVRRGADTLTLVGKVRLIEQVNAHVEPDPNATPKAIRVRDGVLTGTEQQ